MSYIQNYCQQANQILKRLDQSQIEKMIGVLSEVRQNSGRLFFLGVGGSAANCSHAVNDFRKIGGFEAYTPVDNVAELTARTNDEGWNSVFEEWLKGSRINANDAVLVFSVGGGSKEKNISANLVYGLDFAKSTGAKILGVVGRDGGYTAKIADVCVVIPCFDTAMVTPQTESFQSVVWHMIVTDPRIMVAKNKWESVTVT